MLIETWEKLSKIPFGRKLFGFFLAVKVPYTATIKPQILQLNRGHVLVAMCDRRRVRNHLRSIHAVALMNLGEAASGLAVLSTLPQQARAILTHLEIDFLKKARGTLTAEAKFELPQQHLSDSHSATVHADILNADRVVVARVKAEWLIDFGKKS